jgi:hypothetical protein
MIAGCLTIDERRFVEVLMARLVEVLVARRGSGTAR